MNNEENVASLMKPVANTLWLPIEHMKTKHVLKVLK